MSFISEDFVPTSNKGVIQYFTNYKNKWLNRITALKLVTKVSWINKLIISTIKEKLNLILFVIAITNSK